ncbi:hypothetical protein Goklo_002411, partial [Gossypium klotzschianum]|nr:hypothetical protein [Gossypium klotzschianum]
MFIKPTSIEDSVTPPTSTDSGNSIGEASSQTKETVGKRKVIFQRVEVWSHFTKIINSKGASKTKCNYCEKEFCCDGKKWYEVIEISYQFIFDQEASRKGLAQIIVIDELPFKFVESEGFRKFMFVACPRFHIPSQTTMTRDVYQLYLNERAK